MKWLVALALAILISTAVGANVINATRPEARPAVTAIEATSANEPATTAPATTRAEGGAGVPAATPSTTPITPAPSGITLAEVALHASSTDCWLAIDANVYDVTAYLGDHPGGSRTIIPWCGQEASTAFATEDGKGEHSPDAYALLDEYLLGRLAA